jgi:hypothetical protein
VIQHEDLELLIERQRDLNRTPVDDPKVEERDEALHSHAYVLAITLQSPSRLDDLVEILEQLTFEIAASRTRVEHPS